jgi:hypothetical protein
MEHALKVEIALLPVGCGDGDTHWQDECQELVASMRTDLSEYGADVKPSAGAATGEGTRGRPEPSYSTFRLVARSDALVAALPLAWDVLKRWLEPRAGEVGSVRILVDGSEYSMTDLTKGEWLSLLQQRGVPRRKG